MRAQLRQLTSDTAVYGMSSIVGRFLNFVLVPLYTNVFPTNEYGLVAPLYSYIAFLAIVVPFGMESAFMRFVSDAGEEGRKRVFSSPLIVIGAVAVTLAASLHLSTPWITPVLRLPDEWSVIIPLSAWTIAIDAVCVVPFASLRMENRAKVFAVIKLASIVCAVLLNIFFIVVLRMSIVSIFVAGIIGSSLSLLLLVPVVRRNFVPAFHRDLFRKMLRVGLPTVPAGVAGIIIQVIDRPIMLYLTDADTSGIYQANYKLGIFMMLIVSMFQYAWQPFMLQNAREPNARSLFARVLTYFVLCAGAVFLALTLFIEPLVKVSIFGYHILGDEYWPGLYIVPVILLGYVFTGIAVIVSAGLLIEKKTGYMPLVMGLSAATNIIMNFLLIPRLGLMGAALAVLASYALMASSYWMVTRKVYHVPYEYRRLLKIAAAIAVPVLLFYSDWQPMELPSTVWRGLLLLLYGILLVLTRFFEPGESQVLRQMFNRISSVK